MRQRQSREATLQLECRVVAAQARLNSLCFRLRLCGFALHRFEASGVAELLAALESLEPPRVLDLRGPVMVAERGPIPGAVVTDLGRLMSSVADWPKDTPIVTLCACPEDVSSRAAAKKLLDAGYLSVRPLRGGFDAWAAAGEAVGTPVSPDAPSDAPS